MAKTTDPPLRKHSSGGSFVLLDGHRIYLGEPFDSCEARAARLNTMCRLDQEATTILGQVMTELGLSARAYDKIRRVARTIADLERSPEVRGEHVAEAVQYRLLDRIA